MTTIALVKWVHLVAASIWTGGLIVLAAVIFTLRKQGVPRETLQAVARQFGRVSWPAMLIAVGTGLYQVVLLHMPWVYGKLHMKMGLVGLTIIISVVHQLTAKRSKPAVRGIVEMVILLLSLGIFWAAVVLR
jgi:putative copper export protein